MNSIPLSHSSLSKIAIEYLDDVERYPANTGMQVNSICSTDGFEKLEKDWNNLVGESSNPHPFILWEWMFTWWETYQQTNDKLTILTLHHNEKLIAIAPFYIRAIGPFIKSLRLLGDGENKKDAAVTSYPDIIINDIYRKQVLSAFSKYLLAPNGASLNFNYACFNLLHEDSALGELGKSIHKQYVTHRKQSENQFVISLPECEDDYVARLSKSTRKQFRMKLGRIKKAGKLEISTAANLKQGLEIVETLHRARWQKTNNKINFDSVAFKRFHLKLSERFQNQDIMQIRVMNHNEKPIAAAYNFNYKNTCYSYLSGFKSDDDKRYSPMFIFDMLEIKNLIKQGYARFDLLVSESQNNYKSKFGSDVNPMYKVHWFKKGPISMGMLCYLQLRPYLADLYHLIKK